MQQKQCKTCLTEHDTEIHEATVRLHEWLRELVERQLRDPIVTDLSPAA